jgi:hypothetical protein
MPFAIVVVVFIAACIWLTTVKVLNEYERGVMFTLGRFTGIKGPGLILVAPMVQQMRKVDLRVIVLERAEAGRDHARQRVGEGQRRRLLPHRRSRQGHHPGRESVRSHQPGGADDVALGARPARDG